MSWRWYRPDDDRERIREAAEGFYADPRIRQYLTHELDITPQDYLDTLDREPEGVLIVEEQYVLFYSLGGIWFRPSAKLCFVNSILSLGGKDFRVALRAAEMVARSEGCEAMCFATLTPELRPGMLRLLTNAGYKVECTSFTKYL